MQCMNLYKCHTVQLYISVKLYTSSIVQCTEKYIAQCCIMNPQADVIMYALEHY